MAKDTNANTDAALEDLAFEIINGARVLFVTGAGLSVASGIRPYRSSKNAIWNNFIWDWGTRQKFLENPTEWWNKFWLRTHETPEFLSAKPNAGHLAIAHITQRSNTRIVTQNIDGLHSACMNCPDRIIQVHGALGLYKCVQAHCEYSISLSVPSVDFDELAVKGTSLAKGNLMLKRPPKCPGCSSPLLPQSLLFDEQYESHAFYQWESAQQWFQNCDIMVFVGTSFSVGVTAEALYYAKKYSKKVYNFNLEEEDLGVRVTTIKGPSEETLPRLYNYMLILAGKPRMYFYPLGQTTAPKYAIPPRMYEGTSKNHHPQFQNLNMKTGGLMERYGLDDYVEDNMIES